MPEKVQLRPKTKMDKARQDDDDGDNAVKTEVWW